MGDAKRKREAAEDYRRIGPGECTCPLAPVTELPKIDPKCPVHAAPGVASAVFRPADPPAAEPGPAGCICAFQETSRDCPVHGAERRKQLGLEGETIALTREAALPNHWANKEPEPNSFRCPHCGAWRPPYGINGQRATLPGVGTAEYVTVYCGECKTLLQIQILDIDRGLAGGGLPPGVLPGFRHRH